jgi:HAD superfamily hydrolase (TIGR01509 family)
MIKALIFDFDGLILETELPEFQALQEIYQLYGQTLPLEAWLPYIGIGPTSNPFDPLAELEKQLGQPLDRQHLEELLQRRYRELAEAQPIAAGVEEYIQEARQLGLKLGVASSSPRRWVVGHLERLGLRQHFACICCGDEVRVTKPDPEVYQRVLECLEVAPEEAIALEDSPNGVRAARGAGIFCVAVPSALTRQASFAEASLCLHSLAEMPLSELIERTAAFPA